MQEVTNSINISNYHKSTVKRLRYASTWATTPRTRELLRCTRSYDKNSCVNLNTKDQLDSIFRSLQLHLQWCLLKRDAKGLIHYTLLPEGGHHSFLDYSGLTKHNICDWETSSKTSPNKTLVFQLEIGRQTPCHTMVPLQAGLQRTSFSQYSFKRFVDRAKIYQFRKRINMGIEDLIWSRYENPIKLIVLAQHRTQHCKLLTYGLCAPLHPHWQFTRAIRVCNCWFSHCTRIAMTFIDQQIPPYLGYSWWNEKLGPLAINATDNNHLKKVDCFD